MRAQVAAGAFRTLVVVTVGAAAFTVLAINGRAALRRSDVIPPQLVGTWTRTLTAADLRREHDAEFPAGQVWRLVIVKNGTASYGVVGQPQDPLMHGRIVSAGPHRVHI